MARSFIHNGKEYRSYKHPILEYIFEKVLASVDTPPDEIIFTYEDIRQAMWALNLQRDKQASISNFVIDLTRRAGPHESRVPDSIWQQGYDLSRASDREVRQNIAGKLVRLERIAADTWIHWETLPEQVVITIPNIVPDEVKPYLGNDEGALLSVMDYCNVLSQALNGDIQRVQHPKKWQPGEVDGLYVSTSNETPILYPVEAKALSTSDNVNLAQVQGAYNTVIAKMSDVRIIPLAVQMISEGMYIAVFEADDAGQLVITRSLKVVLEPPIESWRKKARRRLTN
jgi:hypothetical protein